MVIAIGAALASVVALVLLGTSFATTRGREFTRPLGIFALIWALGLILLYVVQ